MGTHTQKAEPFTVIVAAGLAPPRPCVLTLIAAILPPAYRRRATALDISLHGEWQVKKNNQSIFLFLKLHSLFLFKNNLKNSSIEVELTNSMMFHGKLQLQRV